MRECINLHVIVKSDTDAIDTRSESFSTSTGPNVELERVPDITIPDQTPNGGITLYRDDCVTLRMRSDELAHRVGSIRVTMYLKITRETEHLIPKKSPYWNDTKYDKPATTEQALPDNLQSLYESTVKQVERQLDISRTEPEKSSGVCHRKHESVGKYGIVSIETRFS